MGTVEALGKVAAIYRMKPDGSFEALESVHAGRLNKSPCSLPMTSHHVRYL
jgi:hypothetical protein